MMKRKIIILVITLVIAMVFPNITQATPFFKTNTDNQFNECISNYKYEDIIPTNTILPPLPFDWKSYSYGSVGTVWHETTVYGVPPNALFCADETGAYTTINHYPAGLKDCLWCDLQAHEINLAQMEEGFDMTACINYNLAQGDITCPLVEIWGTNHVYTTAFGYTGSSGQWLYFSYDEFVQPAYGGVLSFCSAAASAVGATLSDVTGLGFLVCGVGYTETNANISGVNWSGFLIDNYHLDYPGASTDETSDGPGFYLAIGKGCVDKTAQVFNLQCGICIAFKSGVLQFFGKNPPYTSMVGNIITSNVIHYFNFSPFHYIIWGKLSTFERIDVKFYT